MQYITPFDHKTDVDYIFADIITSSNISRIVTECINVIQTQNIDDISKLKISHFLSDKIYNIYKLPKCNQDIVIEYLSDIIYKGEYMDVDLRLNYLTFKNEAIAYKTSLRMFDKGLRDKMSIVPYFQILKYMLKANPSIIIYSYTSIILEEFERLFNDENTSLYIKMEIADIFILNDREERGEEMLNVIRRIENNIQEENKEVIKTIYSDTQNVHDKHINKSVLKACVELIIQNPLTDVDIEEVKKTLLEINPYQIDSIENVLNRIKIDTSRFTIDNNTFNLYELFSSLWLYINSHSYMRELLCRLIEEMVSMSKYCSTGHLSRFINTIQGYTTDNKLCITISDKDQIKAKITNYLDTELYKAPEDVTDSMIDEDKTSFYNFINDRIIEYIPSIISEYGDVQEYILDTLKIYSKYNGWVFKGDCLVRK